MISKHGKKWLAALLAVTTTATMAPAGCLTDVQAAETEPKVIAKYSFDSAADALNGGTEASGSLEGADGYVTKDSAFGEGALKLGGSSYASLTKADGSALLAGKDAITVSYWRKTDRTYKEGTPGHWTFFAARDNKTLSWGSHTYLGMRDGTDSQVLERVAGGSGSTVDSQAANDSDWHMVTFVADGTGTYLYLDGEPTKSDSNTTPALKDVVGDNGIVYLGKANWGSGEYFIGSMDEVTIYDGSLTEEQIQTAYTKDKALVDARSEITSQFTEEELANEQKEQTIKAKGAEAEKKLTDSVILGKNTALDKITVDLNLPATFEGFDVAWTSSEPTVIDNQGKFLDKNASKKVTLTAKATSDGVEVFTKSFEVTTINAGGIVAADKEALEIPNADDIRTNITLPTVGKNGSEITWKSGDTSVITDQSVADGSYKADISSIEDSVVNHVKQGDTIATPAGVVTRGDKDKKVKLTATLKAGSVTETKEFDVTVKAKSAAFETTDYLFVYFTENGLYADNTPQESIHFAISKDCKTFEPLNSNKPVLYSHQGEYGVRDPFIIRSREGDKFYIIATDLAIGYNGDWGRAQNAGSNSIIIWESTDLVNWSKDRMIDITSTIGAGCTWAPEAYYDDKTGEYIVFWASKVANDNYGKQRIYYCKTRDFITFTDPEPWIARDGISTIDTTVTQDENGTYYRFSKNEGGGTWQGQTMPRSTIYVQKADSLLGKWTTVTSTTLSKQSGVEGPSAFHYNTDDLADGESQKFGLLLDNFGGRGYYPMTATDLSTDDIEFTETKGTRLPSSRHGSMLQITDKEYEALKAAVWTDESPMKRASYEGISNQSVPSSVEIGYKLPAKIDYAVDGKETKDAAVTWNVDDSAFIHPGTVELIATVNENGKEIQLTKNVEVKIPRTYYYYINSGHDVIADSLKEALPASDYEAIKASSKTLINQTADQVKTEDNTWGIEDSEDDDEVTAKGGDAEDGSIYAQGWYANGGKSCIYDLTLPAGTYDVTTYYQEWWGGQARPIKMYAVYTDKDGKEVSTEPVNILMGDRGARASLSTKLTVDHDDTLVKVYSEYDETVEGGRQKDPIISGLTVTGFDPETDELIKDWEAVNAAIEDLDVPTWATSDFTLSTEVEGAEGTIAWTSDNAAITVKDGKAVVTRGASDVSVKLTAEVTVGKASSKKEFTVVVKAAVDFSKLKENIAAAKALKQADYTADSWKTLADALAAAERTAANANASQMEVDVANTALVSAKAALKKPSNETTNPDGSKTKTDTKINADGSTTKTETTTAKDGTVSTKETTTAKDGTVSTKETTTAKDGTVSTKETSTTKDGTSVESKTTTAKDGTVTKKVTVTAKDGASSVVDSVAKNGSETVTQTTLNAKKEVTAISTIDKKAGKPTDSKFYKVSGTKAELTKVVSNAKTITVGTTVASSGKTFKITSVGANAFKSNKKITKVTLGKNVTSIGKNAFQNAKKLKTIVIKGKITKVGKNAFKGIKKKATFQIKAKKKVYKKIVKLIKKNGKAKSPKFKRK